MAWTASQHVLFWFACKRGTMADGRFHVNNLPIRGKPTGDARADVGIAGLPDSGSRATPGAMRADETISHADGSMGKQHDRKPEDLRRSARLQCRSDARDDLQRDPDGYRRRCHDSNKGYGGNQKTCYRLALERGADIVIMLHPDYQYTPKLLLPMAAMLSSGLFDVVLGSRILGISALAGGMPLYKYIANRVLTFVQNVLLGHKLSEYHTGYRGFTRSVIEALPLERNSDDFIFDNQMLSQVIYKGFRVGEISCPAKYFPEASSINFRRSVIYGLGVLRTSISFRLAHLGLDRGTIFEGLHR
jgi:hypothetical protein